MKKKVATSVYIDLEDYEWIKEHGFKASEFIREAVKFYIDQVDAGYHDIRKIKKEIAELEAALEEKKALLARLEAQAAERARQRAIEEKKALIREALIHVGYGSVEEAARDLEEERGDLSWEEWLSLVEEVWRETDR